MKPEHKRTIFSIVYWIVGLLLLIYLPKILVRLHMQDITYGSFKRLLHEGRLLQVRISEHEIRGVYYAGPAEKAEEVRKKFMAFVSPPLEQEQKERGTLKALMGDLEKGQPEYFKHLRLFRCVRVEDPDLAKELDAKGVDYFGEKPSFLSNVFWTVILPVLFWVGLWALLIRGMGGFGAGVMSFGKSRAKIVAEKKTGVTFDDVAGCEEAKEELQEVVRFLKEPKRYAKLGAKVPKGVLLVGPPGTGKTLLARAVAGEAGVPFFTISGSEFVEMFVGVGAARVRDLFTQAKSAAPCIIFIDEIDAIGKHRGGHPFAVNDEREQTLNQLLVEMDGFEPNQGVILIAATNRPETLDPALLRPGRFDRQIVVDAADANGREAILKVHARGKPLAKDVNLREIALRTPGFSGADLANVMNEAALLAARKGEKEITQADLEEAVEKVIAGPERKSRRLSEKERRVVAYHEGGHALLSHLCEHAEPVAKISIIPRGRAALGYTLQLPEEERFLITKSEILDKICVSLGGRAAEEIVFGEISSGAQNDLEKATEMARSMVCRFGMSEKVGPVALSRPQSPFLGTDSQPREIVGTTMASVVDEEVKKICQEQYERAKEMLLKNRLALDALAEALLEREVLSREEFQEIIARRTVSNDERKEVPK